MNKQTNQQKWGEKISIYKDLAKAKVPNTEISLPSYSASKQFACLVRRCRVQIIIYFVYEITIRINEPFKGSGCENFFYAGMPDLGSCGWWNERLLLDFI